MTDPEKIPVQNPEQGYETLFQVLLQEAALYEQLIEKLVLKQQAIINGNITRLNELTASEQSIVQKAQALSTLRSSIMQKIFNTWGVNIKDASLSEMLQYSGKSTNPEWLKLTQKLKLGIQQVNRLNRENQQLINSSLQFVRDLVKLIFPADEVPKNTYNKDGDLSGNEKTTKKVLDFQV